VRSCGACVWFVRLWAVEPEIHRDGWCLRHSCFTRSDDDFAWECEFFNNGENKNEGPKVHVYPQAQV
jgi:hypothetical protein